MNRFEALIASDSFDIEERLRSIEFVGKYDDDLCRRAILWLFTDENIAVCDATGRYLIERNDVAAAKLLFMGIAISQERQRFGTLLEINNARIERKFDFDRLSEVVLRGHNFLARVGVNDVKKWLKSNSHD